MDIYPKYTSPFGYQVGDNSIDSYGVDHSGFTTRDEVEYQFARDKREQDLMKQYNDQGITSNYPQYTTNFWGNNAANNYGFGMTNITDNIANLPKVTPIPVATAVPQQEIQNSVQPQNTLSEAYNIYKNKGLYGLGMQYAEPSVQQAIQAKNIIASLPVSDVNKHQYISCIGSTGGALATAETLAGGLYKELNDTIDKLTDSQKRQSYGGSLGVLKDAAKDLKNDFIGSAVGYTAGKYNLPDLCNALLYNPINLKK